MVLQNVKKNGQLIYLSHVLKRMLRGTEDTLFFKLYSDPSTTGTHRGVPDIVHAAGTSCNIVLLPELLQCTLNEELTLLPNLTDGKAISAKSQLWRRELQQFLVPVDPDEVG